jgi:hypothetical protein
MSVDGRVGVISTRNLNSPFNTKPMNPIKIILNVIAGIWMPGAILISKNGYSNLNVEFQWFFKTK